VVVVMAVKGEGGVEEVTASRGVVVGRRGEWMVAAFTPDAVADPARVARRVAQDLAATGRAIALHLAPLVVRRRPSGPPLLVGAALDPATWLPSRDWSGVLVTDDLARAAPDRVLEAAPPLVGRDDQIAAARASLERAFGDRTPGLFTLVGGPGAGKTRLLREIASVVEAAFPGAALVTAADPSLADGDALRALAGARPVAILLDDAHDLDDRLLDALDYAALDGADTPLWIAVAAAGDGPRPGWGSRARHHRRVELAPLAEADAMRLAAHLLEPAEYPPEEALRRIAQMADCRPLALVELCRALAAQGLIRRGPGGGHYLATADLDSLPRSPSAEWLAGRELDRLTPQLAALARLCAALLPGFDEEEIDHLSRALQGESGAPAVDTGVGLFQLRARGLLAADADGRFRIASSALHTGIERALGPDERRRVHQLALASWCQQPGGRALAARAHHAAALGEAGQATAALLALGEEAARHHRYVEADRQFSAALGHAADDEARARALFGRGRMRYRIGRAVDALADLERAEAITVDPMLAASAVFEQATALDWANDYRASAERAERAAALAAQAADPVLEARSAMARGRSAWRADRVADAVELLTLAAEAAAAAGDLDTRTVALVLLAPALVRAGALDAALARFEEVIALARAADDRVHLCAVHCNRMFLWSAKKRPDLARADLREAVHLARQIGQPEPERNATYNLAEDLYWSGEDDREALELARRSRFLQQRFLGRPVPADALLVARVAMAVGEEEEARAALAWVSAEVPAEERSAASDLFARLVEAWLDGAPAEVWRALQQEAASLLSPDDRLEIIYWAARAGRRLGDEELSRAAQAEADACLPEVPIWRRRFEAL
jgi:tetratricopeptide (TPR) repeat protein